MAVADRLCASVRASDTVSRQGGDEFVVLLPQIADTQHAATIAAKLLRAVREPYTIERHELHFTISIGIAIYPDDGSDVHSLLKRADLAMYQAKDAGGNSCQFYKPELNVLAMERHAIEAGLRLALRNEEFVLHYQPRVSLETDEIVGVEALIRWRRPQHALISPDHFIPWPRKRD